MDPTPALQVRCRDGPNFRCFQSGTLLSDHPSICSAGNDQFLDRRESSWLRGTSRHFPFALRPGNPRTLKYSAPYFLSALRGVYFNQGLLVPFWNHGAQVAGVTTKSL